MNETTEIEQLKAENLQLKNDYNDLLDTTVRILSSMATILRKDGLMAQVAQLQKRRKSL